MDAMAAARGRSREDEEKRTIIIVLLLLGRGQGPTSDFGHVTSWGVTLVRFWTVGAACRSGKLFMGVRPTVVVGRINKVILYPRVSAFNFWRNLTRIHADTCVSAWDFGGKRYAGTRGYPADTRGYTCIRMVFWWKTVRGYTRIRADTRVSAGYPRVSAGYPRELP